MTKSLFEKALGNVKFYWEKSRINILTVIVYKYWIFDIPIIDMSRIGKKKKRNERKRIKREELELTEWNNENDHPGLYPLRATSLRVVAGCNGIRTD